MTRVDAARWEHYVLLEGAELEEFWRQHLHSRPRSVLFILGRGFDPRLCFGLKLIVNCGGDGPRDVMGLEFKEGPRPPALSHDEEVKRNWADVESTLGSRGRIVRKAVEFWSSEGRRISSQSARDLFQSAEELAGYTDVIVDVSAMPRSVYFPLVARLLFLIDHGRSSSGVRTNLHLIVAEDSRFDASIQEDGIDERADFMASFGGGFDEEALQIPKVWLPMLGENRGTQLDRIHERVRPDEICPVLPSPAKNPRRADDIVIQYHDALFDQYSLGGRNFLYASEHNPFEVYRRLRSAVLRYRDVFRLLGGCRVAVSPLSSKLMSLGALLVAYELKENGHGVGVAHIECQGYILGAESTEPDLVGLWLTGECDAEQDSPGEGEAASGDRDGPRRS